MFTDFEAQKHKLSPPWLFLARIFQRLGPRAGLASAVRSRLGFRIAGTAGHLGDLVRTSRSQRLSPSQQDDGTCAQSPSRQYLHSRTCDSRTAAMASASVGHAPGPSAGRNAGQTSARSDCSGRCPALACKAGRDLGGRPAHALYQPGRHEAFVFFALRIVLGAVGKRKRTAGHRVDVRYPDFQCVDECGVGGANVEDCVEASLSRNPSTMRRARHPSRPPYGRNSHEPHRAQFFPHRFGSARLVRASG